jgi:DNA-binding MarR family transcriptional regulator
VLSNPSPDERPPPLLRLLTLSTQQLAGMLHERLRAAGFDDQRPADDAAFAHIPGEGIRLTDLARRAGVSKQAMAELVDSLEARGYVERQPDPTDGRAKFVVFSERGWTAVATALDALDDIE